MFSALLLGFTFAVSIVFHIFLKGQNIVEITADGAGRTEEAEANDDANENKYENKNHATVTFKYPLLNVAGVSNF